MEAQCFPATLHMSRGAPFWDANEELQGPANRPEPAGVDAVRDKLVVRMKAGGEPYFL